MNTYEIISTIGKGETKMSTKLEDHYKTQYIDIAIEYECELQKSAALYGAMMELKTALEKIANLTTGESSRIACEALDVVFPVAGATK